ncbi:MAG TPA: transglutaminase domain-containing protein [Lacunisphaera sp.]|nr:transglutaminase domain-containing protein [Lacunisphaera sp.]
MHPRATLLALAALALASGLRAGTTFAPVTTTYRVEQNVTLSDIPAGAKNIKWWIAIPNDNHDQKVLDFSVVSAPGAWSTVVEPDHANRFMLVEVTNPPAGSLTTKVAFTLRRSSVFIDIDPAAVGPITDSHRRMFTDELRPDAPHMTITSRIAKMAADACGAETNVALQAKLLLGAVCDFADHYSRDPSKPSSSTGDAESCLAHAGGTCTDMHSLFIAMARSRGIPARLQMGYRLREPNAGKEVDPSYRCWVEYFVPGYGWVPADIPEADDPKGLGRARWFSGLTERRLWLSTGREFNLAGRAVTDHRVNAMFVGYAEIDGVEARAITADGKKAQLTRTVRYTEVATDAAPVTVASTP